MRTQLTFLFTISSFILLPFFCFGQEFQTEEIQDSIIVAEPVIDTLATAEKNDRYGLRVGIDLSRLIRTALDENYEGFQVVGDFRIKENYYLAAELGTETKISEENTFDAISKGSYIKAGFNYNAYDNWYGMSNLIYVGLRAGFATFSQELDGYNIYTTNTYFEPDFRDEVRTFEGLNATWLELQLGVQAELFANFYLGINLQLKRLITQKEPDGFANLYIPGFNKVTTDSTFGVGYGYTLTYFIPIFKK